jgi:peptidoglycan/LPS O-acetylase OafA/YrhL
MGRAGSEMMTLPRKATVSTLLKGPGSPETVWPLPSDKQPLKPLHCGGVIAQRAQAPGRLVGLDFAKGTLVLIMALYHWMNYFVSTDGSVYKYLRFLTPSFIFITGFLIAQVYLGTARARSSSAPKRLLVRAAKLLAIVLILNLATNATHVGISDITFYALRTTILGSVAGSVPVVFSILFPIAYLLLLSSGLLVVSRWYSGIFHVASALSMGLAYSLDLTGTGGRGGYLQLLSIGLFGASLGHVSIARLNRIVDHRFGLLLFYIGYLAVITYWGDGYLVQVAGVCVTLAIMYWIGNTDPGSNKVRQTIVLLGRYSLFGYIIQILILQLLRRGMYSLRPGIGMSFLAFLACIVLTILSIQLVDYLKKRSSAMNRLYTAVFS